MNRSNECIPVIELLKVKADLFAEPLVQNIFFTLYGFVFFFGFLGNIFVVFALVRYKQLKNVYNLLIASLAGSDAATCLFCLPITAYANLNKQWIFGGNISCKLISHLQVTSVLVSGFSLMGITLHRYNLIVNIQVDKSGLTRYQTIRSLLVVWVPAVILSSPFLIVTQILDGAIFTPSVCGQFCLESWNRNETWPLQTVYGTTLNICQYFLPLAIMVFCSVKIVITIRRQSKFRSLLSQTCQMTTSPILQPKNGSYQRKRSLKETQRTKNNNQMLFLVTSIFAISWLPNILFNICRDFDWFPPFMTKYYDLLSTIAHLIAMSSTLWNPILYAGMNPRFKAVVKENITIRAGLMQMFRAANQMAHGTTTIALPNSKLPRSRKPSKTPSINRISLTIKQTSPASTSNAAHDSIVVNNSYMHE